MEPFQVLAKVRLAGLQIPDRPDDDLVLRRHVEHPLVVLEPGAGFHFDRAYDAQRHGDLAIPVGQRRLVQDLVIFRRPGHALRARRVEQMNMRVDDRQGCGLSKNGACRGAEQSSAIHAGIVSLLRRKL